MRTRSGNSHNEEHGKTLRCYDWIAPASVVADDITAAIKPHLDLLPTTTTQAGYVQTYRYDDGLHVHVVLYEACDGVDCASDHAKTEVRVPGVGMVKKDRIIHVSIATPSADVFEKIKSVVGEHDSYKLGVSRADDLRAFRALGAHASAVEVAVEIAASEKITKEERAAALDALDAEPALYAAVLAPALARQ